MVPTTGLEPINKVFSPLPMVASFSVFIAHTVTSIINNYKHKLCICGKSREENRVQIVCKKTVCANFVQTNVAPDSVQTCAKASRQVMRLYSHLVWPWRVRLHREGELTPGGDLQRAGGLPALPAAQKFCRRLCLAGSGLFHAILFKRRRGRLAGRMPASWRDDCHKAGSRSAAGDGGKQSA